MLSNTLAASLLLLLTPTVLAAPTRTHCSCKVVYNSETLASPPPPSAYTPSAAHWTPSNPSQDEDSTPSPAPIPVSVAVCASLGSELERFRHTEPELYDLYMGEEQRRKQQLQDSIASKPLPTAVLLRGNQEKINPSHNDDHTSRPSQPQGRIVCFASTEPVHSHEYQTSHMGLCALQLIVVLSIIACVVEGLQLCRSFIKQHFCSSSTSEQQQEPRCFPQPASHSLRLGGSEKRLLAIPETHSTDPGYLCSSPGADKKLRAYENGANVAGNHSTTRFFVQHGVGGRREFIAYDDDSDDEVNRPVM